MMRVGAVIACVAPGSIAERHGISAGDTLLELNGHEIVDVLDYRFYMTEARIDIKLLTKSGKIRRLHLIKEQYEDLGLDFSTYLIDEKHRCRNNCVFCFIDQMPPGMRESLYFKDDDDRLSFLMGNYITLTNISEREVERILAMHLSPVNISVHTTNPELRVKMMRNKNAGRALDIMRRFAAGGIHMNCQIVLCKGLNDSAELDRTMNDLGVLYPAVQAVAVVPVGLTRYRQQLYPLQPFAPAEGAKVLEQIDAFAGRFYSEHGTRLVFAADEFYLMAGRKIPPVAFYEELSMLENGVGLIASLRDEFSLALEQRESGPLQKARRVSLATGVAAAEFLQGLAQNAQKSIAGLECFVYAIENRFFGHNVNVAGLVTGGDLIDTLRGRQLGGRLLIPAAMLRHERDRFLDDVTLEQVERELQVRVTPVENDGFALLDALTGEDEQA